MKDKIKEMSGLYEEYLVDESKFSGKAESISFPKSEEEIIEILREIGNMPVTIQGSKTGIVGGCVPTGGHILNLSSMNKVLGAELLNDGTGRISVEAGIVLEDLRKEIDRQFRGKNLFWPPNPTETSASIGGIVASNAQGINEFYYGSTREFVEMVSLIDDAGNTLTLQKGQKRTLSNGEEIDEIDLALGKEGITGIISKVTLKLVPKAEAIWGIVFFFEKDLLCAKFFDEVRANLPIIDGADVVALEYMDKATISQIQSRKMSMTKIRELPDIEEAIEALAYIEIQGNDEATENLAAELMEAAIRCDSDPEKAWAVSGEAEILRLQAFRHSAAETTNLVVAENRKKDSRITKLSTDMCVIEKSFSDMLKEYKDDIEKAGLEACIFGHGFQNHLHVNLLPKNYDEYKIGIALLQKWACEAVSEGGNIACEHGIGKLKRRIYHDTIDKKVIEDCKVLKMETDKSNRYNIGNIYL